MNIFDDNNIKDYVEHKLFEIVGGRLQRSQSRWNFRCPICGDSKKSKRKARGNYYPKTVSYYCFNDGCSAKGLNIISKFTNLDICEIKKEFIEYVRRHRTGFTPNISQALKEENIISTTTKDNKLLIMNDWIELPDNVKKIIEYRKLYSAEFKPNNWKLYYNKTNNRIVIPWYRNNKFVWYQERAIDENDYPKYSNAPDLEKDIFNYDIIDESLPYVFLIEGVFDTIFVKNGVGIGGWVMTENQKKLLDLKFPEKIYFLDNPWVDQTAYDKILNMSKESIDYKVFLWPQDIIEKDVNEYVINHVNNPFADINFMNSNVTTIGKAIFMLKFNRRIT